MVKYIHEIMKEIKFIEISFMYDFLQIRTKLTNTVEEAIILLNNLIHIMKFVFQIYFSCLLFKQGNNQMSRSYQEELQYIEQINPYSWRIKKGFVPNMNVEGIFYVNDPLKSMMFEELKQFSGSGGMGGFLPGMKQIANVAALPGIVGRSVGLPDVHSGYGFAIGNVAAFDMSNPEAVVSPGGVGFDINCGVRLLRTNLCEKDVLPVKEQLAQ